MRILVLGGQHIVGGAIVEALIRDGVEVSVLSRNPHIVAPGVQVLLADRYSPDQLATVLTGKFDCVVDVSGVDPSMISTLLDVECIRSCSRYIFISSASIYDRLYSQLPFTETAAGGGDSIWGDYGAMKWQCEEILRGSYPGTLFILRPPYVYGPRNPDLREQFVWSRAINGIPIPVPGDGLRRMQFCYSLDLARCVARITQAQIVDGGTYNVGGDEVLSQMEYVRLVAGVAGADADIHSIFKGGLKARDYFPFRDADFYINTSKAIRDSIFTPTPIEIGLKATLDWFQKNRTEDLQPNLSGIDKMLSR
ncbi:NAD-dependent epimerase/dehydratase family protein [Nocardia asteroides]|uniref:NAD-dependent epimerase/dehydratase family protein n=1 Tax=Nocardia asteroides TaxID=1824 RepID=UPI001E41CE26|nr:NAD-dependent epimerase/dehydratase family protein [Nocardia asteroides]UGT61416.1 NAD-dependent epimerase/dehydratase family protein [Nocardia asteroides]